MEIPILQRCYLKIADSPFKVGGYLLIPKGKQVWNIEFQSNISFEEDQIIELTHNVWSGNYGYGKLKQLLWNIPGFIPTLIDKGKGEIGFNFEGITQYIVPKPTFITYKSNIV